MQDTFPGVAIGKNAVYNGYSSFEGQIAKRDTVGVRDLPSLAYREIPCKWIQENQENGKKYLENPYTIESEKSGENWTHRMELDLHKQGSQRLSVASKE